VIIGNCRHARQLVETLRERTLIKIDRAVGKRLFRVGAPNDRSDEVAADIAVGRLTGNMEAPLMPPSLHVR
jgi:hypothetical protein